ncbi:ABC transporter permease [Leptolyngbya sp. FACHB-261]|nr:ABC transporter permease [Leptolyngbya sp. FACHB-261]
MRELLRAEFKRSWIQSWRYPSETIGGIVIATLIFYGIFLSARYIAGPSLQFGDRLDSIVVGYVLWDLVVLVMNDIAIGLQIEAQTGTLEQLFLSPFGAAKIFLARGLASLVLRLILTLSILLAILLLTGSRLAFPPSLLLPLAAVLLGAYGLAFLLGALSLLLKRIQQLLGIFQFALFFLLATPIETWTGPSRLLGLLLPMASGAGLLRDLMAREQALDVGQLALALLSGVGYFSLGLLVFTWAERQAKRQGILSGY